MPKKISRASKRRGDRTLVVDIGASGIKALVLDAAGRPLTVRDRIKTPSPSTPGAVLSVIRRLAGRQGRFDRVAVGFPGVIRNGVVETASNLDLDQKWCGFRLAEKLESKLGRPVRVANDADLQGGSGQSRDAVLNWSSLSAPDLAPRCLSTANSFPTSKSRFIP